MAIKIAYKKMLDDYITSLEDSYPSTGSFVIYIVHEYKLRPSQFAAIDVPIDVRRYLYDRSKNWLMEKVASGAPNSQAYLLLLKELHIENADVDTKKHIKFIWEPPKLNRMKGDDAGTN